MDGRIFSLKKIFKEKLNHDWTAEEMAETAQLSTPHFQKLFKTQVGTPPVTYLREIRLEKARELLENSHYQIKQIGVQVGMTNDSHLTRDFKKKFGLTPTEYRKRHWEKSQAEEQFGQK